MVLYTPSVAVASRMFKVLETYSRYRFKEKNSLFAMNDLKLKYVGDDESYAKLLIKLYFSVITPKRKCRFVIY